MAKEIFEILITEKLAAQRVLEGFPGKLGTKHYQVYRIDFTLKANSIDERGVTCDFDEAKSVIASAIEDMQGAFLNEIPEIIEASEGNKVNPTGEVVARVVWKRVAPKVKEINPAISLEQIVIAESPSGKISYRVEED